jgi:hypothetical protein
MLLVNGYREISVASEHAVAVNDLLLLHKDPFDRILVALARVIQVLSQLRGNLLINWIPACAGMTVFFLMNYPG